MRYNSFGLSNIFKHKGLIIFILSIIFFLPMIMGAYTDVEKTPFLYIEGITPFVVGGLFIALYIVLITNKITPALVTMFGGLLFVFLKFVPFNIADFLTENPFLVQKDISLIKASSISAIDWNTLSLLSGMMIMVGIIKITGFFQYVAMKIVQLSRGNLTFIWIGFCIATAVISAFLDNVTTVLIIVPVTMLITDSIGESPIPFIITEILCANIGGAATLIGDPPNILIGSAGKLSFVDFIVNLTPIAFIIMIVTIFIFYFVFKKKLKYKLDIAEFDYSKIIKDKKLLIISLVIFVLVLVAFVAGHFFGIEPGPAALFGAIILMIAGRQHSERWFKEIEWDIIFFFIGLFIMVKGLELQGILGSIGSIMVDITGGDLFLLSMILIWAVGIASSFIGAVPVVTTLIPILAYIQVDLGIANIDVLWWSMSLGACLGGNGTIFGSACNMIAASLTAKRSDKLTFFGYFKVAYPIMLLTLAICSLYIYIFYFVLKIA